MPIDAERVFGHRAEERRERICADKHKSHAPMNFRTAG
jgi:hypothetical protein